MKYMNELPDKSIDIIITDPPYGINIAKWDKFPIGDEFIKEMLRVSKNQIIFGGNFFSLPKTEAWVIWYKDPFLKTQSQCEMIWTSFKFKPKVLHYRYAGNCEGYPGNLRVDYKKKALHPTQKPVEVMSYLIKNFTDEEQTILDPFMGSGSTGVSAVENKRNFIGIEKDENYFNLAKNRLKEALQKIEETK